MQVSPQPPADTRGSLYSVDDELMGCGQGWGGRASRGCGAVCHQWHGRVQARVIPTIAQVDEAGRWDLLTGTS